MENLQVILYPKQIHIAANANVSIRLTYKKMTITTNHELEKYQNRQFYPVKNNVATINDEVKFKISKEFQLHNTKIVIILIGTKGREVSCLGDISLDLASIKEKKGKDNELFKAKIEKSKDPKALLFFDIRFIEKPVDLNELKRKKQKMPELGILKTDHYYKQELYISRRQRTDKPTAYEISRKNYKNNEILRNNTNNAQSMSKEKRQSKDSAKENTNNGSYKKRFLYEVQRNDKNSQKSSSSKSIRNNYLSAYQKDKSPSPRIKTPEPITLETLKSRQTHGRIKSKVEPLNLSEFDTKKVHFDDSNELIELDTFRGNGVSNSRGNDSEQIKRHNKEMSDSNISEGSLSSIKHEKDSKYKLITDKLELIESKIRKRSRSKEETQDKPHHLITKNGHHKISKSEIDQVDSYSIVNEYEVSRTLTVVSNPNNSRKAHQNQQNIDLSKHSLSPMSPAESTCPLNEPAPSPIQVIETPTINKSNLDEIKMSEFTINSKKSQVSSEIDAQKSHQRVSQCPNPNPSPSPINPKSFNQINLKDDQDEKQEQVNTKIPSYLPGSKNKKESKSPQSNGQRELSPSSLSFERRETELKLQKKSSLGQNYLEIQIKMLQLEIQDKNMKLEKFQKKLLQKQEALGILSQQKEEFLQSIRSLSTEIIDLKVKNVELQKQIQDEEHIRKKFIEKQGEIRFKEEEIVKLRQQIQKISDTKQKQECHECENAKIQMKKHQARHLFEMQRIQSELNLKNKIAEDLKSQLQTYQQEVSTLRQRLNETQSIRTKYEDLVKTHENNLKKVSNLEQKICVLESQKNGINESMNESKSSSKSEEKSSKSQLSQEVLKQTIEKQGILQQSLKSLESRNKYLTDQVQNLQKQKQSDSQKASQIINQQKQALKNFEIEFQRLNARLQQSSDKLAKSEQERIMFLEQIQKKQKIVEKLSELNESLQSQLYQIQNQQPKPQQFNEYSQELLIKNAQNEQLINQLKEKLNNKQKQMKILKNLLKQKENQPNKINDSNKQQMRRQIPQEPRVLSKNGNNSEHESTSKSQDLLKIKVTEQGKQNFYDQYINQKAKCVNLEAQLRFAQNQIRNHKMRLDLLVQEKNTLEKQLEKVAFGFDKNDRMKQTKPKNEQKVFNQTVNHPESGKNGKNTEQSLKQSSLIQSLKMEQKQAQEEIQRLQSQAKQLHSLLDEMISKESQNIQGSLQSSHESSLHLETQNREKYLGLAKKLEVYQMELRENKNKMAEIVNAIWRGGNASLIDEIDRIMSVDDRIISVQ